MIISSVSDLKLVARSATNRVVFYDSSDRPIVGIKITDQVQVNYTDNQLIIVNNQNEIYRFTIYALYDIDGKGFTPIDNNSYTIEDYQQKLQEAFEWLQTVVLVSCCDGGANPLELRFYPNFAAFPTPGTSGLLYIDEAANTIYRWDAPNYVMLGGGGGGLEQATASGTDTYTATIAGVASYADGDAYLIRFTNGNTTGCTLDINGLGARTLYRNNDGALIGGDIVSGAEMLCIYNTVINGFQVIGTAPNTLLAYVTNADSVTITKGQVVYAFGGQGDRMTVKRAANTADSTSAQTVGLVLSTSIAANQKGLIMMQGLLDGLSILPTATYSDGDPIYLGSTPGSITKVKPYAPNHLVYLGVVTTANNGSAGRMYVKVQNGYELDELHNVQAQTPSFKDTLWYDNTVSPPQWKTASLATILGYTPVPDTRNITINGTTQDLSADRTWTVTTPDLTVLSVSTANQREDNWAPTGWPGTDIVKVIDITPTNADKVLIISGLSNPAAGRIITLRNSGANQLIILEQRGSGSIAANRFNFTGNGAYFLLPERSVTLLYDGTYWNQLSSTGIYGGFDSFDDFTSITPNYATTSSNMYHFLLSGTGSGVRSDGISGFYGTIAISTGTTTTGNVRGSVDFRRGAGYLGGTTSRPAVVLNKVFTPVLPAVGNDYYFQCGLNGATPTATAGTAGFGFNWQVPTIASGVTNWQTINSNTIGTIVNTTTSGLALTTSAFVWLGIFLTGVHGEAVYFYSTNGSDYIVDNRFLRTSGNYLATPYIGIVKTTGTTARDVQVDFSGVSFNNTVR
jgi:hypothetical protein